MNKRRKTSKAKEDNASVASSLLEEARKRYSSVLDFSGQHLPEMPETIAQLHWLLYLYLPWNELAALPNTIGQLRRLKSLHVSYNRLTALPETLCQLKELEYLSLSNNKLTRLPATIGKLTQLKELDLSHNELKSLPESLLNLGALQALYLHGNDALGLPAEVLGPTAQDILQRDVKPTKPKKILEYYFRLRIGRRPLNEAKLILVGRGGPARPRSSTGWLTAALTKMKERQKVSESQIGSYIFTPMKMCG